MKIGFFDSGLGGLLMMESCRENHPDHDYCYVGDTAHLPYGPRTGKEIAGLIEVYLLYLFREQSCDYVCIACNTASVRGLPFFLDKYPQYKNRLLDIVAPTQELLTTTRDSLVLATTGTVKSKKYDAGDAVVAMPGLVECIESHKINEAIAMVKQVVDQYSQTKVLVLACTHYKYLEDILSLEYPNIDIVSQAELIAEQISRLDTTKTPQDPCYFLTADVATYTSLYKKDFKILDTYALKKLS